MILLTEKRSRSYGYLLNGNQRLNSPAASFASTVFGPAITIRLTWIAGRVGPAPFRDWPSDCPKEPPLHWPPSS